MRRVLVPSAQLMYHRASAVVPTHAHVHAVVEDRATTAPSRVSLASRNTELDLESRAARSPGRQVAQPTALPWPEQHLGAGPASQSAQPGHSAHAHRPLSPAPQLRHGPTAHRRSRRARPPLTSQVPEHSSTPGEWELAYPRSPEAWGLRGHPAAPTAPVTCES